MAKSFFIKDKINEHFTYYSKQYYVVLFVSIVALILGLIVSFNNEYLSLLNSKDQIIFEFIIGDVNCLRLFYSKLKNSILCFLIVFLFNATIYISFLSYIYLGYQIFLLVISCAQIISLFGFGGVIIVVFLIIPINLINLINLTIYNAVLNKRAYLSNKYKIGFSDSFKENNIIKYIVGCLLVVVLLCFIYSFIIPLYVKNLSFIIY